MTLVDCLFLECNGSKSRVRTIRTTQQPTKRKQRGYKPRHAHLIEKIKSRQRFYFFTCLNNLFRLAICLGDSSFLRSL